LLPVVSQVSVEGASVVLVK